MTISTLFLHVIRTVLALCAPLSAPFLIAYSTPVPRHLASAAPEGVTANLPVPIVDLGLRYLRPAESQVESVDFPSNLPDGVICTQRGDIDVFIYVCLADLYRTGGATHKARIRSAPEGATRGVGGAEIMIQSLETKAVHQ